MKPFLSDDFLLETETAKTLYRDYAEFMPIFDYHCHLPVEEIAENKNFENLTQIWLYGDHYKWRAMRAYGIDERLITGNASDFEKFAAWAETVPKTLRNPLYHWTHMELKNPFGIKDTLLNPDTTKDIYDRCTEMLQRDDFSTRGLLKQMNVKAVCTTDDPTYDLSHHRNIEADDSFSIPIVPTFRPDKAMAIESPDAFNEWVDKLEASSNVSINNYVSFVEALRKRHDAFHEAGCRSADHGQEQPYAEPYTEKEIENMLELTDVDWDKYNPGEVDMEADGEWTTVSFRVTDAQAEVINRAIDRITEALKFEGRTATGRAMELIAADSMNTPLESYQ